VRVRRERGWEGGAIRQARALEGGDVRVHGVAGGAARARVVVVVVRVFGEENSNAASGAVMTGLISFSTSERTD
jgi:hypothetical protein